MPYHDKYIVTQEFKKLAAEDLAEILKQVNLASKNDIAYFVKKIQTLIKS